jgi:3-oxoacyl-[acyl-carrier-protein] synthase II
MDIFINSAEAISPQNTFSEERLLHDVREYPSVRMLRCIEPSYAGMADPMAARRMSRIVKMSLITALSCLRSAGISNPDAIITGTGMGCLEDTAKFLSSIYENREKLLNPTPFIQSTHNTVGAAIAHALKCRNYNNTYCHSGFSFENALIDAMMLLREEQGENVLAGSADELTPSLFRITDRLRFWKKNDINNLHLFEDHNPGSLPGEGTAFFCLSSRRNENSMAKLVSVRTMYKPGDSEIMSSLPDSIYGKRLLVILGTNGDPGSDMILNRLRESVFKDSRVAFYKHLCGEYDTSVSFALYLAARIMKEQKIPGVMLQGEAPADGIDNILIYNQFRQREHSAILISGC